MEKRIKTFFYALLLFLQFLVTVWLLEFIIDDMSKRNDLIVFGLGVLTVILSGIALIASSIKFLQHLKLYNK